MTDPVGDPLSSALHGALSGLAMRQRVISDNIANVSTPGFLAGRVDFEDALQAALAGDGAGDGTADPAAAQPTVQRSLDPTRTDGNNVDLEEESLLGMKADLSYQLTLRALDSHYSTLRTAMRSS